MLSVDEALKRVMALELRLSAEQVRLAQAAGRVLAEDIRSPRDVPAWDNSSMDGYAVRAADATPGACLRLNQEVRAGVRPEEEVLPGTATPIMTGAPVPAGADAVIPVELTDGASEGQVILHAGVTSGQHIRRRGEGVRAEEVVLRAGLRLRAPHLGMAAALGIPSLLVSSRPVVAILSTGDELVPPGQELGPGQIYSANNTTLSALVAELGGVPLDAGHAPDEMEGLLARLQYCIESADVVLTTGGVSMGTHDLVREAWARLGVSAEFWKVAVRPGKPLTAGSVPGPDGAPVVLFGLPGNPVSCAVSFGLFVRPLLLSAMGYSRPFLPVLQACCLEAWSEPSERAHLVRVTLERAGEGLGFRPTGTQSSGVLRSLVQAHGLLLLAPGQTLEVGQTGRVQLMDPDFLDGVAPHFGW